MEGPQTLRAASQNERWMMATKKATTTMKKKTVGEKASASTPIAPVKADPKLVKQSREGFENYKVEKEKELRDAAKRAFGSEPTPEQIKKIEELIAKSKDFNIDFHCVKLMQRDPFFCRISQHVKKCATFSIPTAAMAYRGHDFVMYYNPMFMAGLSTKDDEDEVRGVLKHEFYHLVLGHITLRRRENMQLWNIATDLAINSLIVKAGDKLPKQCLFPGRKPQKPPPWVKMTPEEKKANELMGAFIKSLPGEKASEWYYGAIKKFCEENSIPTSNECQACKAGIPRPMSQEGDEDGGGKGKKQEGQGPADGESPGDGDQGSDAGPGEGEDGHGHGPGGHSHGDGPPHTCGGIAGVGSFDDHDGWSESTDDSREYVESKVRKMVGDAVRHADQSNSWGTVPAEMAAYLREKYSNQVNWKQLLRQFTGHARGTTRIPSIKVINRRYAYIHPGTKRGRTANLWIFVDQSGSVDDRSLELLFGELNGLTRHMDIKVFPFDTSVDDKNVINWRRGMKVRPKRTRCGGTSYHSVVDFLEHNKGQCDGALILSDGECDMPKPAPCKFGYLIVPGRKLMFTPRQNEIHIQMKEESTSGDW